MKYNRSEYIKAGVREGFQNGTSKYANRRCDGYEVTVDGSLVIDPDEAKIVRWMFQRYLHGDSLGKIASCLEKQEILSPTGNSEMYETLDKLMAKQLPQMELYCEIGKAVCRRTEKGAAVMASEYLNKQYPDAKGFSPRSLRRMRDFYRTYENHPALLSRAMQLGWIQNVVIMEADLTMELREWYMMAAEQFGWSKMELIENINNEVYKEIVLDIGQTLCDNIVYKNDGSNFGETKDIVVNILELYVFQLIRKRIFLFRCRGKQERLCYVLCQ